MRLAWRSGGYFSADHVAVGAVAFVVLALVLAVGRPGVRVSNHGLVGLGALIGLTTWTGVSAAWSPSPDAAVRAMELALVYVGLFGLGLLGVGTGRYARYVVWGVLVVIVVVVGAGLLSRLFPGLLTDRTDIVGLSDYRLGYPLSYWNAYGGMAATGAVLALGLAADPRASNPLRTVCGAGTVVLVVAMYLSLSRGAWLALVAGTVVLALIAAHRGSLLISGGVCGGGAAVAVVRLQHYPGLFDAADRAGQRSAGASFGRELLLVVVITGALQAVVAAGRDSEQLMDAMRSVLRPVALGLAVLLTLGAFGTYVVRQADLEGWSAERSRDATSWVSRQWRDFLRTGNYSASGSERLTSAKGARSDHYRVAFDGFEAHPLRGDGAGGFPYRWARERRSALDVRNAHSLEFETLGELGAPGGLLLLAFLAAVGVALVRSRWRPGALSRSQAAAVGAAVAVWLVHSAVDWDWQMPAYTGAVLLLASALFPGGRRVSRGLEPMASPPTPAASLPDLPAGRRTPPAGEATGPT